MTASQKPPLSTSESTGSHLPVIGWREKVALPELAISTVKAKIDTGARSSALHAFDIEVFQKGQVDFVRFKVHPIQRSRKKVVEAEAALLDMREVRNSGGKAESQPGDFYPGFARRQAGGLLNSP